MAPLSEEVGGEEEGGEDDAREEQVAAPSGPDKDGWLELMGGTISKRVLTPGSGAQPDMKQDVRCSFEVRLAGGSDEILQRRSSVRYRVGEGEAVPCLELGLRHMCEGEECEIFGAARMAWGPTGLPAAADGERAVPPDADVLLRVALHECLGHEGSESTWNGRVQEVSWRKENGNDHFRRKEFHKAARCYAAGLDVFQGCFDPPEDLPNAESAVAAAASMAADLGANLAAVHLELGAAPAAKEAATAALQVNPDHVKSLYRAARACFLLDEFEECEAALDRAIKLEPENAAVRRLEAEFQKKKQRYADRSKRVATNILQGLRGPDEVESSSPEAAAPAPAPELCSHSGAAATLAGRGGRALASWARARRRELAAVVFCGALLAAACAALPVRHWHYCFIVFALAWPVAAALAESSNSGDAMPKKQN